MSTVARGGGGSRGGRGRGQGTGIWRGSATRGGRHGASTDSSDKPASGGAQKRGGGGPNGGSSNSSSSTRNGASHGAQELGDDGHPKPKPKYVPLTKYGTTLNSTPHAHEDYKNRFLYLQAAQPSWRRQLQDRKQMNPDGQMKLSDSVKLVGLCNDMCPEYERVRRIEQVDYKRPECTPETEHLDYKDRIPDESRMVKAFTRSSAGADVELVIDIRSPAACLRTVNYLFKRLDGEGFDYLHAWIWDRTRSVRKDLRTQVVENRHDIQILLTCLEASARFYLLSMHQMAQSVKEDYSHQQDMEQFNQTLTTLRERYDDNRRAGIASDNEAEFVAYRLILASLYANSQLENELHSLPSDLRHNKRVLTAIEIFKAAKSAFNFGSDKGWIQAHANWKKFWDLIKSPCVSYLMACAAEVSFNRVRHVILDSLWHAYRKGPRGDISVDAWTTNKLKDILAMDEDKDVVKLCELFGFHFEKNAQGQTYLDIAKMGNSNKSIGVPHSIKPQMFSQSLVESKRCSRTFSAVIQGMAVQQAKTNNLLVDSETGQMGNKDSLFVPDSIAQTPNTFGQNSNRAATTNGTSNSSLFASPFIPPGGPPSGNSSPNMFENNLFNKTALQTKAAQVTQPAAHGGATPGVFDAAKNLIRFAPTPASSANSNPLTATAVSFPPQSMVPASTPSNTFTFGIDASQVPEDQIPGREATSSNGQTSNRSGSDAPTPFVFPRLPALDARLRDKEQSGSPIAPAWPPAQPDIAAQAAEKQKAEDEARQAVRRRKQEAEEQRKREQEEQERKAKEAQQTREAEQRRIEEESQQQRREQQERDLRAKQERERLIREEQERQQQKEQERLARIRQRETAYNALTSNIVFSGEEGLLYQFLENTVKNVTDEVTTEVRTRQRQAREAAEKAQKSLAFTRAVFARWVAQVQKKKRNARAKARRRRLRAQREQSINGEDEDEALKNVPTPESEASTGQHNDGSMTINASSNSRRVRPARERHTSATVNPVTQANRASSLRAASPQFIRNSSAPINMTNGHAMHVRSYSEAYHKSTAPIDRTETDWFKLRAMGIDPSKHRKRSFDSSTEEELKDAEAKRVRRSDPVEPVISQPPPQPEAVSRLLTIDERLARIRAAKQSFRRSGSASSSVNGATLGDRRSSINGRSSLLITQARDLIAKSPVAQYSTPIVHDFGRSVPNLSTTISSFRPSTFGKSAGTAQSNKPAYWGRASRFVPQHLYGKGPEAIRAYRDQYVNSPTSTPRPLSTERLVSSSPVLMQSCVPHPGYTQLQYSEDGSVSGVDLIEVDAEDNIAGDTEEDSFDGDDEEVEGDEDEDPGEEDADDSTQFGTYAEECDENEYTEEEEQDFAQLRTSFGAVGPGATQDDAIELSD